MDLQSFPNMQTFSYQFGDEVKVVRLERAGEIMQIAIAEHIYEVSVIHSRTGELTFKVDGVTHTVFLATEDSTHFLAIDGDVFELTQPVTQRARRQQYYSRDNLVASMPGQVTQVLVNDGVHVQRGQPLIVLEAMKMEIKIAAPRDGHITKVLVRQGQVVDRGHKLIEIDDDPR
jgi:biotin carboxyl carrier protein